MPIQMLLNNKQTTSLEDYTQRIMQQYLKKDLYYESSDLKDSQRELQSSSLGTILIHKNSTTNKYTVVIKQGLENKESACIPYRTSDSLEEALAYVQRSKAHFEAQVKSLSDDIKELKKLFNTDHYQVVYLLSNKHQLSQDAMKQIFLETGKNQEDWDAYAAKITQAQPKIWQNPIAQAQNPREILPRLLREQELDKAAQFIQDFYVRRDLVSNVISRLGLDEAASALMMAQLMEKLPPGHWQATTSQHATQYESIRSSPESSADRASTLPATPESTTPYGRMPSSSEDLTAQEAETRQTPQSTTIYTRMPTLSEQPNASETAKPTSHYTSMPDTFSPTAQPTSLPDKQALRDKGASASGTPNKNSNNNIPEDSSSRRSARGMLNRKIAHEIKKYENKNKLK